MGRHFFTGGLMPSTETLLRFQEHVELEARWLLDGTHYQRTAEHWLANHDAHRESGHGDACATPTARARGALESALAHVLDGVRRALRLCRRAGVGRRPLPLRAAPVSAASAARRGVWILVLAALAAVGGGCMSTGMPTVPAVRAVDLPRFMGAWYVIASIPSYPERNAYDAVESYELRPDGRIQTTFRYREGQLRGAAQDDAPRGHRRAGNRQCGVGHAVHLAHQGRVRDLLSRSGLLRDHYRAQQARLRLDHGAHARRSPRPPMRPTSSA